MVIEPVTRIEGHAKVTMYLDDAGNVERALMHVNEFRGFEKFCEGRMYYEMPLITERICGICPVSHHLASAKACDALLGEELPKPASLLRELMHMGQIIQSHAMHFFELAGPDLLLGFDADPAVRNVVGVYGANPELATKAIRLRKFGQEIIARVGDRRIHPSFAIPGGVNKALPAAERDIILTQFKEMYASVRDGLNVMKAWADAHVEEMKTFANFETAFLGMVDENDALQLYDGPIRLVSPQRQLMERFDGRDYLDYIAEHVEDWSYLKFPYCRKQGWPAGTYRVGPLARLHAAQKMSTPLAQAEYEIFQKLGGGKPLQGSLYYHYARLIELLYAVENAERLLNDPDITSRDLRVNARLSCSEGVGVIEAPRGTLWHHYWVDGEGKIEKVNLIVATGNNNYAMSRAVAEVARQYVKGPEVKEGMLNRVEAAIRAYDPCLSCSTHAVGQMPLVIDIADRSGGHRILHR
ncbi:MAG: Ni/Fe hydrogenase subunit alpha [Thermomicrobiales bacterium]|nr:Ni/Fe hydrogenase subunit alpha [Thermomicrobiales bacterium]